MTIFLRSVIALTILLITSFANAQPPQGAGNLTGRIYGKVIDAAKNTPLEYSSVTIQNLRDSSKIFGALVDEKGLFEITSIPLGAYKLTVSFVGYKDFVNEKVLVIPRTN